ncbi:MAG: ATP-binding protein [Prevotella sp.]|nr:ATP-binding protein [Prevotella sp.]MDY4150541.1 ATP-binding protein [Prevotella sp.]
MKDLLKQIILEQQEILHAQNKRYVQRYIADEWLQTSEILIISGIRRCGKSVLMQQIRDRLVEKDFFFNFDDERLANFKLDDFQKLQECFVELFGEQHTYYFDEIQNIEGWERFVRRLYNAGNKIVITGSNARMLSRELGTHLTGRYIQVEIYPFSFQEYLAMNEIPVNAKTLYTTTGRATMVKSFVKYMECGGFPKFLQDGSVSYLTSLYESIIYRDILTRNGLTNEKEMLEMMFYLASNATKRVTYSSLGKVVGIQHPDTIKNYLEYIQQTYLISQLFRYDPSVKKQMMSPKKIYFVDNAIIKRIGFNATENNGVFLENLVFIELKRRGWDVYYYADKKECDFIVRKGLHISDAYQVTLKMDSPQTREREIAGVREAMQAYSLSKGYILTFEGKETINFDDGTIVEVVPVWEWILQYKPLS